MFEVQKSKDGFHFIYRALPSQYVAGLDVNDPVAFIGPFLLDAFASNPHPNFVSRLAEEIQRAGLELSSWSEADRTAFLQEFWKSAHAFLTENYELIDRSPELAQIAQILRKTR